MQSGLLNRAFVPTPLLLPGLPPGLPANMWTTPLVVIDRTLLFPLSPSRTYDDKTIIPWGQLNFAFVPVPSLVPLLDWPAITVTTPELDMTRTPIVELPVCVTYRSLSEPPVMYCGVSNRAFVPAPSTVAPVPSPAKVVTSPFEEIIRITLLPESAKYIVSVVVMKSPKGLWKVAAVPLPSALPELPDLPAKVVTVASE